MFLQAMDIGHLEHIFYGRAPAYEELTVPIVYRFCILLIPL